jgi:hypothetical protein
MIRHGEAPYLECSSKGDKRFSAMFARVNRRGGGTIEEIYQASKVLADGRTNLSKEEAKGKVAVNMEEVRSLYTRLWVEYIAENMHLAPILTAASGVSDIFGQPGHACQATELWEIRRRLIAAGY